MKNYIQNGDYIDAVAPEGGVESGDLVVIGGIHGVAVTDADAGDSFSLARKGIYTLPKADTVAFDFGDSVYAIDGETTDDSEGALIGFAAADAAGEDATAVVLLD